MIDGRDILELGYPEGRIVGLALAAARGDVRGGKGQYRGTGGDETEKANLAAVKAAPGDYLADPRYAEVAREWLRLNGDTKEDGKERKVDPEPEWILEDPLSYGVWGGHMIEGEARSQMDVSMRLPVSRAGALMPDSHVGYGLPIGGVLATEGAVIPWAVGVDIGCSMRLTVLDVSPHVLGQKRAALREALVCSTAFGAETVERNLHHEVLDDPAWDATGFLRSLKDVAARQLGSSGSGNHFVEIGAFEALEEVPVPGGQNIAAARPRLALLSHSGSRGAGKKVADHYSGIAREKHPRLPEEAADLAWLDVDGEEGAEYWMSMDLAGRYAAANHEAIHERLARAVADVLGASEEADHKLASWANAHNLAWREQTSSGEAIVHRKGATPAGAGVMGVIPGSMTSAGYLVRGLGNPDSIASASHGAGRVMGRGAARRSLADEGWRDKLAEKGLTLVGGDVDERPEVYKDIDEVLAAQSGLIESVGRFTPAIVRMASGKRRGKNGK